MTLLLARTSGSFSRLAIMQIHVDCLVFSWLLRQTILFTGCACPVAVICNWQLLLFYHSCLHRYVLHISYQARLCALHIKEYTISRGRQNLICLFEFVCLNYSANFAMAASQEPLLWSRYLHCTTNTRGTWIGTRGWFTGTYQGITR